MAFVWFGAVERYAAIQLENVAHRIYAMTACIGLIEMAILRLNDRTISIQCNQIKDAFFGRGLRASVAEAAHSKWSGACPSASITRIFAKAYARRTCCCPLCTDKGVRSQRKPKHIVRAKHTICIVSVEPCEPLTLSRSQIGCITDATQPDRSAFRLHVFQRPIKSGLSS